MPPSKGRMLGPPRSRMSALNAFQQQKIDFRSIKLAPAKKANSFKSGNFKDLQHNDQLKKLRIPASICKALPSVRRYANSKGFIDTTDSKALKEDAEAEPEILGQKKGRAGYNKYKIKQICEKKFEGMIWNLEFSPAGDVVICSGEGILLCDLELNIKVTLDNIRLAGGVAFLSDHRLVALCRFADTVNIFTSSGAFIRSFPAGTSPMNVSVNSMDEIIVTDIGAKCLRMFRSDGTPIRVIPQEGTNYQMKWPLYLSVMTDDSIIVSDCHQQKVLVFDFKGRFVRHFSLKTCAGNEVLRPHGVCTTIDNDTFIVDNATDSVEVFSREGSYVQTIIPSDKGAKLKPKVLRASEEGLFVVGGMSGMVQLFRFIDDSQPEECFIFKEENTASNAILIDTY
ncbi:hypothetical protein CAPTEDRAFT_225358 [Capitella teleta]|uniref:Uncharacterized protein n=1 Tax=Capitella teleta TaxID=283909 RepID=R7TBE5_CAPTE|nr:hypothetical protein CAPTEDRAFT_225358 [Capitella teleta]|eukprot:ELT91063.1 hypothetical protein CAPTEDRAFT_225358 [Capitella teleta]